MVEMIALRGHVTQTGAMVLAGQSFRVPEDEAKRYQRERPHLATPALAVAPEPAPSPRRKSKK